MTPHKPTVTPQQPTKLKECNNIPSPVSNHYDSSLNKTPKNVPTETKLQRKPSNTTSPSRPSEDSLTPTQLSSPVTPPVPLTQLLRKPAAPVIAKKPGIPPPVSKKPLVERRNSKPQPSPDQLPDYPSPQRVQTGRQEFPSPLRIETDFPPPPPAVSTFLLVASRMVFILFLGQKLFLLRFPRGPPSSSSRDVSPSGRHTPSTSS